MHCIWRRFVVVLGAATLMATGMAVLGGSSAGAAKSPILIGYIGDDTGVSSSTFADGVGGAQARIDLQNAEGGVDGRQLKLVSVDSTSTTTGTATAVQELTSVDHVFGIVEDSAFFFAGAKFAQEAGVPVTGYGIDGPEWYEQPNTNMFQLIPGGGPVEGQTYTTTTTWSSS